MTVFEAIEAADDPDHRCDAGLRWAAPITPGSDARLDGDNFSATFSPDLSDLTLYVIDVYASEKSS